MKFKTLTAATLAVMVASSTVMAQEITLRFQHFISPKGSVPARFMTPWIEKVQNETGGKLKIELYPGMQLGGKPPALYDQIRDGVIDGEDRDGDGIADSVDDNDNLLGENNDQGAVEMGAVPEFLPGPAPRRLRIPYNLHW